MSVCSYSNHGVDKAWPYLAWDADSFSRYADSFYTGRESIHIGSKPFFHWVRLFLHAACGCLTRLRAFLWRVLVVWKTTESMIDGLFDELFVPLQRIIEFYKK